MISWLSEVSPSKSSNTDSLPGAAKSKYRGLSNQGATCYLNSLLQALYMTPEFRSAIYKWEYNEEKDGDKADCIPYQLQSLFGQMQLSGQGAITTKALTQSFGWGNAEAFQQQDVQVWQSLVAYEHPLADAGLTTHCSYAWCRNFAVCCSIRSRFRSRTPPMPPS